MSLKVIGVEEIKQALAEILKNIKDAELVTKSLADSMRQYVHVDTGYLKSTIFYQGTVAGASAPYAGYEADRGDSHDYASLALNDFDIEAYADTVVEPF